MKRIVLFAFLLISAFSAFAQKGFQIGVRVAPQASFLLSSDDFDDSNLDPRPVFKMQGGISLGYHFTDKIGAGIELLYNGQGSRYIRQYPPNTPDDKKLKDTYEQINLDYLSLPVLFKFNGNPDSRVGFQMFVGPQFNFLLNANNVGKLEGNTYPTDKSFDYEAVNFTTSATVNGDTLRGQIMTTDANTYFRQTHRIIGYTDDKGKYKIKDLYNNITIGVTLGLGMKIKIIDNLHADVIFRFGYDITDAEKKDAFPMYKAYGNVIDATLDKNSIGTTDYYDTETLRTLLPTTSVLADRSIANNVSVGLQIGATYTIGGKKSSGSGGGGKSSKEKSTKEKPAKEKKEEKSDEGDE